MTSAMFTAQQVGDLLDVDVSTIYRMAADGRLPAVHIGRQWRFPADGVERILRPPAAAPHEYPPHRSAIPPDLAQAVIDLVAEPLGVMMVVTDMGGRPLTVVANPCAWFADRAHDPDLLTACIAEWRELAAAPAVTTRLEEGRLGFRCASSLVRDGTTLVGMVLAGGIGPDDVPEEGLHHLDAAGQQRVVDALPRIAALLSRLSGRVVPVASSNAN